MNDGKFTRLPTHRAAPASFTRLVWVFAFAADDDDADASAALEVVACFSWCRVEQAGKEVGWAVRSRK